MQYIIVGTTYEGLKNIVYQLMNISFYHWNIKIRYKYTQIGVHNTVRGYYIGKITTYMDVSRMLSISLTIQIGLGAVSMFIETEKFNWWNCIHTSIIGTLSQPNQVTQKIMELAAIFTILEHLYGQTIILVKVAIMSHFRDIRAVRVSRQFNRVKKASILKCKIFRSYF